MAAVSGADEQPTDLPRYLDAIRRGGWLIVLIVVPLTATVLALSLSLPKSYSATATLVIEEPTNALTPTDAQTATRRLATMRALLTSRDVLSGAASNLPGESLTTLRDKVSASVDSVANLITLQGTDNDPRGAAALANAVAATFIARRRDTERRRLAAERRELQQTIDNARAAHASRAEIRTLRDRLSELSISGLGAGGDLEIAQAAVPPDHPSSPRPLQNTAFALLASLFLAVLAALGRDRLAPRVADARELTTLSGLAPLVVLPGARGRRRVAQVSEAYEALAASLRVQLSDSQRIVLVTSPHPRDGRSSVVVGLGRALAASGQPTLVVSADLRSPGLHKELGVPQSPGLGDVLDTLERNPGDDAGRVVRAATRAGELPSRGELRGLPSGDPSQHPAALLAGESLGVAFEELGRSRYRYVLVEGPPLLGPIDGQLVARWADAVLVVCRLDRLVPREAQELGEILARLDAPVLGSVVIGGGRVRYSLPAWTPMRAPT
jgi:Mrp family chromosome partitioning ATPase/capsular polysaccharide biosynthesis protein